jgi:CYTH domain-containing protein
MIERERKFELLHLPVHLTNEPDYIQQGYITIENDRHVRVRIINQEKAFITLKIDISATDRHEYEYVIPLCDGVELFEKAKYRLTKFRHKTRYDGNDVDIDIFINKYKEPFLRVVEIEYQNELLSLPLYCGRELTGLKEYSNIQIAIDNEKD